MKNILFLLICFFSIQIISSQNIITVTKNTDPDPYLHPFNDVDSLCDADMYGTLQWAFRKANSSRGVL